MPTGIVTVSQYSPEPPLQFSVDDELEVRGFYTRDFIAGDGVTSIYGNFSSGEQAPYYYSTTPTLNASGNLVVPAHDIQATTLSNPTANYFEGLWVNGAFVQWLMPNTQAATGWQIPTIYGSVIAIDEIALYNRAKRLLYPPDTYPTFDEVVLLIRRLAGNFDYMAVGVNGIGRASFPPVVASEPIVLMENDPRVGSYYNILAYSAATTNTAAQNTVFIAAAVAAASAGGGGIYIPRGTFALNAMFITVPILFAPGASILAPATGQTVICTKAISADTHQHFGGLGTISFSGNVASGEISAEWFGTTGALVDCSAVLQAALTAAGTATNGLTVKLQSTRYFLASGLLIPSHVNLVGNGWDESELYFENAAGIPNGIGADQPTSVRIRDLKITGSATSTLSRGIYMVGIGSDVRIERVWVTGVSFEPVSGPMAGIAGLKIDNFWVTDCYFTNNGKTPLVDSSYDLVNWTDASYQPSGIHFNRNVVAGFHSNYSILVFEANDVEIHDNIINQNNQAQNTISAGYGIAVYGAGVDGDRISIRGNNVQNTAGSGIYGVGMGHILVDNNIVTNSAQQQAGGVSLPVAGIALTGLLFTVASATATNPAVLTSVVAHLLPTGLQVNISGATGNWAPINGTFTVTRLSANTFSIPVDATGFGALTGTVTVRMMGMSVTNNTVTISGYDGIAMPGLAFSNAVGNKIYKPAHDGLSIPDVRDSSFSDNTIDTPGAIGIHAAIGFTRSVAADSPIRNAGGAGLDVTAAVDSKISGNIITNAHDDGLAVRAGSLRTGIIDNHLNGNGTGSVLNKELLVVGSALIVSDNNLLTTTLTNGLDVSSASDSIVESNIISGYTNGIVIGGTNCRIKDNVLTGNTNALSGAISTNHVTGILIGGEGDPLTIGSNTIAPTFQIHQVGAGLIKTITVPSGLKGETVALVPTAAFTYDATSNVLGTGTAVVGRTMFATYSISTSKWSMSY